MAGKRNNKKFIEFLSKYWVALFIVVAILGCILSSFSVYKEEVLNIDPDIEYEEQNTLYFAIEKITDFNPYNTMSEDVYYLSNILYSYLFKFDENMMAVPELISDYSVKTKDAYIEFTIREDAKFSNGNKITPSDVVNCVIYSMKQGTRSPYYDQVKKINSCYHRNGKIYIYFKNNYNCSTDDLVIPIIDINNPKVGTGRYYIARTGDKESITLKPNKNYFGEVANKKVILTILPKRSLGKSLMDINEVTCYTDDSLDRKSSAISNNYVTYDFPSNNVDFMIFNTNRMFIKKDAVRKALIYSIDREEILADAYMDDGILTDTVYYPNFLGTTEDLNYYEYNPEKALSMLKTQGFNDRGESGKLKDILGKEFEITILTNQSNHMRCQAARLLKKDFESIGIRTNVVICDDKDFKNEILKQDYDILITGYSINPSYDLRFLFDGSNEWGFYDSDLLKEARELDRIHSEEKYREKYIKLKEDLIDSAQYFPLCYRNMSIIGIETFKAEKLPMFNNPYKNIETWSWKKILK